MSWINRAGRPSLLGFLLLAITSVRLGLNFPIMKQLLTEWPSLSSRGLCGIAGVAALVLFALARRQKLSVARAVWLRLLIVSMLSISAPAATTSIGTLLVPVIGVLAAAAMLREIAALVFTLGGVAVALRA